FGELMRALFSGIGSFLVGGTAIGLVLIGRSQLSFIAWVDRIALAVGRIRAACIALWARVGAAWTEARAVRRERADAAGAAALPVIETPSKDEAILAHLADDDDSDWIPIDRTGAPPIALSQALRDALAQRSVALATADDGSAPPVATEAKSAPPPKAAPA